MMRTVKVDAYKIECDMIGCKAETKLHLTPMDAANEAHKLGFVTTGRHTKVCKNCYEKDHQPTLFPMEEK